MIQSIKKRNNQEIYRKQQKTAKVQNKNNKGSEIVCTSFVATGQQYFDERRDLREK